MQKSTFITVLSWIFIVLSAFATLVSITQNILYHFFIKPQFNIETEIKSDFILESLFFSNFGLILIISSILIISFFISSVGLLKRKNWARISIMVFLGLGITYNTLFFIAFNSFSGLFEFQRMDSFEFTFLLISLIVILGFCSLFTWIIIKLNSHKIKEEFLMH